MNTLNAPRILIFCLLVFVVLPLPAQDRSQNVWLFGQNLMMDFNNDPVSISSVFAIDTREATSSGCDPVTGELLLYSNGSSVFNAANVDLMQGITYQSGISASQGVMIMPTGVGRRFFVFTIDQAENIRSSRGASYSIVDMDLNGGRGAVVPEATSINLMPSAAEGMAAIHHRDRCSFWLLLHTYPEREFYAFRIEGETVYPPVVTSHGQDVRTTFPAGIIKISPDARKVVYRSFGNGEELKIMDFDNATGILSNPRGLASSEYSLGYGVEFTSDSKMLYVAARNNTDRNNVIARYNDLDSPDAAEDISTIYEFPSGPIGGLAGALEMAPDNNIYVSVRGRNNGILAIYAPNSISPRVERIDIEEAGAVSVGLPTHYSGLPLGPLDEQLNVLGLDREITICQGETIELIIDPELDPEQEGEILWDDAPGIEDRNARRQVLQPMSGTRYIVNFTAGCRSATDTVDVIVNVLPTVEVEAVTPICAGSSVRLSASGAESYSWEPTTGLDDPFSATPLAAPTETTRYTVTGTSADGCEAGAEVTVVVSPELTLSIEPENPQICNGQSVVVRITSSAPLSSVRWEPTTGVADPSAAETEITVSETTTYQVFAESVDGCVNNISITVTVDEFTAARLAPMQPVVCAGQDLQLQVFSDLPLSSVRWSPASGLSDPNISDPIFNFDVSQTYTIDYTAASGCQGQLTAFVEVRELPELNIDKTRIALCPGTSELVRASGAENYRWLDETGEEVANTATWEIPATQPSGRITVIGENADGCSAEAVLDFERLNAVIAPEPRTYSICAGESVQLQASGGVRYRWSPAIGLDDVNSPNPLASPRADTEYQLEVFNADGCSDITSVNVEVTPQLSVELIVEAPAEQVLPGDIIDLTVDFRFSSAAAENNESREFTISIDHPADALRYVENSLTSSPNLLLSTLGAKELLSSNQLEVQGLHDGGVLPQAFSIIFQMQVMLFTDPDALLRVALADVVVDFGVGECLRFSGEHLLNWSEVCLQSQRGLVISGGRFALQQPVPNPVAGRARIVYSLGFDCDVELLLTDNLGRVLKTLVNERQDSGMQTLEFETGGLAAGNYRYVLRAGPFMASHMLLVR